MYGLLIAVADRDECPTEHSTPVIATFPRGVPLGEWRFISVRPSRLDRFEVGPGSDVDPSASGVSERGVTGLDVVGEVDRLLAQLGPPDGEFAKGEAFRVTDRGLDLDA